jgi:uncharacterized membrane protein
MFSVIYVNLIIYTTIFSLLVYAAVVLHTVVGVIMRNRKSQAIYKHIKNKDPGITLLIVIGGAVVIILTTLFLPVNFVLGYIMYKNDSLRMNKFL